MSKLGLILNMVGTVILGLTPVSACFDVGLKPVKPGWYAIGWGLLFVGFLLSLIAEWRIYGKAGYQKVIK